MFNWLVSVGSDHAGYDLKVKMIPMMREWGYDVADHGCDGSEKPSYFPGVAKAVCEPIVEGKAEKGVMFCGTGVGASVACNKIPGIRASILHARPASDISGGARESGRLDAAHP